MKVIITPEEILKRCLWDKYEYYIIDSKQDAEEILKENKEFEISEEDALIIGLLKVLETENLIHKFNSYITNLLTYKSIKKETLLINKNVLHHAIKEYYKKFPEYWKPDKRWEFRLKELIKYIEEFTEEVDKLEIHKIVDKYNTYELYASREVKKLLKFNYI